MKTLRLLMTSFLALSFANLGFAAPKVEKIDYENGAFEGVWVQPDTKVKKSKGSILMVHNWMGISDETIFQAKRFADLGYSVFLADIYGKGIRPKSVEEAAKLATLYKTDRKSFRQHLNFGLRALQSMKDVDSKKIVAMGYCFGGTGVLELARNGSDIKGVVSFHGGLDSPNSSDGKNIKAQVLAHHGAIDPYVKKEELEAFEKEMKDHQVKYELVSYPGAVHSFTEKAAGSDVSKGAAYNASADQKSFEATRKFLKKVL